MCEAFTRAHAVETLCLRPVFVVEPSQWAAFVALSELGPARGSSWHCGVIVDVRDVADAFSLAVTCPSPDGGHARLLLCADDVASDRPAAELVAEHLPQVPWRDGTPPAGRLPRRARRLHGREAAARLGAAVSLGRAGRVLRRSARLAAASSGRSPQLSRRMPRRGEEVVEAGDRGLLASRR